MIVTSGAWSRVWVQTKDLLGLDLEQPACRREGREAGNAQNGSLVKGREYRG